MNRKESYNGIPAAEMKLFLEEKYLRFNNSSFISPDPVSIPHMFSDLRDREISGFLTATIAWGRRDLFLRNANELMDLMDHAPFDFLMSAGEEDFERFGNFIYRTFNGTDCKYFMSALRYLYGSYYSLEDIILEGMQENGSLIDGLSWFRTRFFELPHNKRCEKHFADLRNGAAGKRLNMFLRWMVRKDNHGVDFGIWKRIDPSILYIPLDLHSGNTARKLGLLKRKVNDWKAVEELTEVLRGFDPADPVKYDFALFGLGVNEKF
jgi:uncharacterized protein (TIGR02757 family)